MATTKAVILDQPSHWDPWIFTVKSIADRGDAWEYVNPGLAKEPVIPEHPTRPMAKDVNLEKASIIQLDNSEKETYKLLMVKYREDSATTKQILEAIQA